MRARLSGLYSLLANRQGMVSASASDASARGPGSNQRRPDLPPRGLFKLRESSVLAISAGDLTKWKGDAIVNAANEGMLGGGGVDGAIHRAAGRQLMEACYDVQPVPNSRGIRCPTGEARITPGFRLDAKFVIHTVGPVYENKQVSAPLLRSAIENSLLLCKEKGLKSIAFPAISCGVYGYPADEAAEIAIETMLEFSEGIDLIEFVLFGKDTYNPFFAKASEKLEAVHEADSEASPDKADDQPESNTEGTKTKDDDAPSAAAEPSPSASEAVSTTPEEGEKPQAPECDAPAGATSEGQDGECDAPTGATLEAQDSDTAVEPMSQDADPVEPMSCQDADTAVEPMSQEDTLGALDGSSEGGAKEPMSQEEAVGGLAEALDPTEGGEPMSQSGPEQPEEVAAGKAHEEATSSELANNPEDVPGRKRSAPGEDEEQITGDGVRQGVAMETDETTQVGTQTAREEQERGAASGTCDSSAPNKGP